MSDNLSISMTKNLRADELLESGDGKAQVSEVAAAKVARTMA